MEDIPKFHKVLYTLYVVAIIVLWLDIAIWRS
jgi:cell division protein FtsL